MYSVRLTLADWLDTVAVACTCSGPTWLPWSVEVALPPTVMACAGAKLAPPPLKATGVLLAAGLPFTSTRTSRYTGVLASYTFSVAAGLVKATSICCVGVGGVVPPPESLDPPPQPASAAIRASRGAARR